MVVGSANTAFDILEDCHSAGLQTTMIARSPTYVFPVSYVFDPHSLGACDHLSTEEATEMLMTLPVVPDTQLARGLFSHLSSLEPYVNPEHCKDLQRPTKRNMAQYERLTT